MPPYSALIRFWYAMLFGMMVLMYSGCTFMSLKEEVEILEQTAHLQGKIHHAAREGKPIIVLLYTLLPEGDKLVSYSIYHKPDVFHFVHSPGKYRIAAFEDANEDLRYQKSEHAGYYGAPSVVTIEPGKDLSNLDITLQHPDHLTLRESPDLSSSASRANRDLIQLRVGEVVNVRDPMFSHEKGQLGLWEPIRFLEEVGGGVFFLEPFSESKTPVIFVHGAGGTPRNWEFIINRLDRTQFQPWIFYYPSGFRLEWAAELLRRSMSEIYVTHKFHSMIFVAHSMGGLVSRAIVNFGIHQGVGQAIKAFITISTPWGGHQAAQMGVERSLAVIQRRTLYCRSNKKPTY